ncbi:MAG: DUF2167 domain-containing protein [Candidatus Pacebacteria bacterium]|nr:DUF2167 domain-containing protein [Candidatus Paceibacterota bacterium]
MKNLKTLVLGALMFIPFFGASAATSLFGDFEGKEDYDRLWAFVENYEFKGDTETMTSDEKWAELRDALETQLVYSPAGTSVSLAGGKINTTILPGYTFLSKGQALFLFESALDQELTSERKESIQGIIVSNGVFFDPASLFVFVEYDAVGYVSDEDAATIDGEEMAKNVAEAVEDNNNKKGSDSVLMKNLMWLQKPVYDASTHVFHFANYFDEVYQGEIIGTTVNASTLMLGRGGFITSTVVSTKEQLDAVASVSTDLNKMISFTAGNTYTDYNPETDKKSDLTIAGLAAGVVGVKVLAKLGIWAVIAKFGKLIVLAVIAFFGKIKRGVRRMLGLKVEENPVGETATAETVPTEIPSEKLTDLPSPDTK